MRVAILDDYHDTLRTLDAFGKLAPATTSRSTTITCRTSTAWRPVSPIPRRWS
jgi:hypothetical protein